MVIKIPDMTCFSFGNSNLSNWMDRGEMDCAFLFPNAGGELVAISFEEACVKGAGEMALRALICPTSHTGASVWIAAHPRTKADLKARLGNNCNSHVTPHITLKVVLKLRILVQILFLKCRLRR